MKGKTGFLSEPIMRRTLMRHPGRNACQRVVRLWNDDRFDAAIVEPPDNQYGLAAAGMESRVDPTFDRLFVGSMTLFRAKAGPHADCPCDGKSGLLWYEARRGWHRTSGLPKVRSVKSRKSSKLDLRDTGSRRACAAGPRPGHDDGVSDRDPHGTSIPSCAGFAAG
jgi:hypothetical protein